jgi:hypothetical protein
MPGWKATYILVIASKSGWSEHFIRWELPLARGMAYYHAARVLEGERCRWPGGGGAVASWVDGVRARIRGLFKAQSTRRA